MAVSDLPGSRPAAIKAVKFFLAHTPDLVRYGSKPRRELARDPQLSERVNSGLRQFSDAVIYPPTQVMLGNLLPDQLREIPRPWYRVTNASAHERGLDGRIVPEDHFYGLLKVADDFDLIWLEDGFSSHALDCLRADPLLNEEDLRRLASGRPLSAIQRQIEQDNALPLIWEGETVGAVLAGHAEDPSLAAEVILENMACKATGMMALRDLTSEPASPASIDYLLGCGEEAVGDRYNRGGGNLAKAMGEASGCANATGVDVKSFCCAPVHAIIIGAGLISAGVGQQVAVVGGCSLAKLGMKFQGHLAGQMPILEDTLVGVGVLMAPGDGKGPVVRLDGVGKHPIGAGSSQRAIFEQLVATPLERLGISLSDVDKFATELHDPEVTEPAGSGDISRTNYRIIANLAVQRGEIDVEQVGQFVEDHGMPGFSPTQGHIASAVPFLAHGVRGIANNKMKRAMFLAKGSLFLGRMTHLSDGASFVLEAPNSAGT